MKVKVYSLDGNTNFFDIIAGVLQEDTLALYLFIICLNNVLLNVEISNERKWLYIKIGQKRMIPPTGWGNSKRQGIFYGRRIHSASCKYTYPN